MDIIINPGSGPVEGSTIENADANMEAFAADVKVKHKYTNAEFSRAAAYDGEGRYAYVLYVDDEKFDVEMPGLPLAQVRWVGESFQNIWDFPRLYVDGNSWVWRYAVNNCSPDEEEN